MPAYSEDRRIPLAGADNFRDLGGYPAAGGRRVRSNRIFRSGHLAKLTDADLLRLESLEIRRIVDFRGPTERRDKPDRIPRNVRVVHQPIDVAGDDLRQRIDAFIRAGAPLDARAYLTDVNRRFAGEYTPVFRTWIGEVARNDDALPQVFHCTAGKDRAGFAAAVLLRTLGVPLDVVFEDYLRTNAFNAASTDRIIKTIRVRTLFRRDAEIIRPLLEVREEYLRTAFRVIDDDWGSFEAYVEGGLGLDDAARSDLADRLLD